MPLSPLDATPPLTLATHTQRRSERHRRRIGDRNRALGHAVDEQFNLAQPLLRRTVRELPIVGANRVSTGCGRNRAADRSTAIVGIIEPVTHVIVGHAAEDMVAPGGARAAVDTHFLFVLAGGRRSR